MATVTKEHIGLSELKKSHIKHEKTDYLPTFDKSLKIIARKQTFRDSEKEWCLLALIKKMYGPSLFTDEVLRTVDRELIKYLEDEKLDIFAQPLPVEMDIRQLDVKQPG
jgi:trigger factor